MIAAQGDLKITAFTPFMADSLSTASTHAFKSSASTVTVFFTPIPSSTFVMSTFSTTFPIMVRPVPGWGWWPVMAVVELSRMHRVRLASLYTALTMPVRPEAKKVESPTKEKYRLSGSTRCSPWAMVIPAPMHRQVSTISRGFALPRV